MTRSGLRLTGKLHVAPSRDKLFDDLADVMVERARDAVSDRGVFHVALSGGSTPEPFYMHLVVDPRYRVIPWEKTHVWLVDERRVPEGDERSNMRMIRESLTDHVPIPPRHVHAVPVLFGDPATAYEAELRSVFGHDLDPPDCPRMDVLLLGMGDDCHTASLFPMSAAVAVTDRWIAVNEGEHVTPPDRVTMTYPMINAARHIGILIVGEKKQPALHRVEQQLTDAGPDPVNVPISAIKPTHGDGSLAWYLDAAAAVGE